MADLFLPGFAKRTADKGENLALTKIHSSQLRNRLFVQQITATQYALIVPQFWATYIHDGRGPVTPKTASLLIWFRNPKDDPRLLNGRTPDRLSQTRRMTKGEFKKWSRINRQIIQNYKKSTGKRVLTQSDIESLKLPMIVAKQSPRGGGFVPGYPFFSNDPGGGMFGFINTVAEDAKREVSQHVKARLSQAGLLNVKKTVTIRL